MTMPTRTPTVSPTRTKATWKPGINSAPVPFFCCDTCGAVFVGIDGTACAHLEGNPRRPDVSLPYTTNTFTPSCCGVPMTPLVATPAALCDTLQLTYDVVGGFNMNTLRAYWSSESGILPRWLALKTFTGVQLKYVLPGKKSPIIFALGDEDAYAYCDEDPCRTCTFHCKRGFELYAYAKSTGLVSLSIHEERITN